MFDYLLADLERKRNHYFLEDTFFEKFVKTTMQLGTIAAFFYRFGSWSMSRKNFLQRNLFLIVYYCLSPLFITVTQVHINPRLIIGRGFIIHNFSNIVIDAESVGENFTVNQGVSVGPDWLANGKPLIGSNVFIGSGAKVLGSITIGSNVVVAANAFVNKSIPDNCTVAGVPARVISRDATSNYLHLGAKPKATV